MILVEGEKYACIQCIRGHRSSTCQHTGRPLVQVRSRGRPSSISGHRVAVFAEDSNTKYETKQRRLPTPGNKNNNNNNNNNNINNSNNCGKISKTRSACACCPTKSMATDGRVIVVRASKRSLVDVTDGSVKVLGPMKESSNRPTIATYTLNPQLNFQSSSRGGNLVKVKSCCLKKNNISKQEETVKEIPNNTDSCRATIPTKSCCGSELPNKKGGCCGSGKQGPVNNKSCCGSGKTDPIKPEIDPEADFKSGCRIIKFENYNGTKDQNYKAAATKTATSILSTNIVDQQPDMFTSQEIREYFANFTAQPSITLDFGTGGHSTCSCDDSCTCDLCIIHGNIPGNIPGNIGNLDSRTTQGYGQNFFTNATGHMNGTGNFNGTMNLPDGTITNLNYFQYPLVRPVANPGQLLTQQVPSLPQNNIINDVATPYIATAPALAAPAPMGMAATDLGDNNVLYDLIFANSCTIPGSCGCDDTCSCEGCLVHSKPQYG